MRKSYLKISLAIHPDRIGREFGEATKAFQVLVTAFERCTEPENIPSAGDDGKKKGKEKVVKIQRSNSGCHQTYVCCPRCKTAWGAKVVSSLVVT